MDSIIQFFVVLIIFIGVLFATALVTRFVGGYQKSRFKQENLEVMETLPVAQGKYIQIIRVGNLYMAVGLCKDTMTMLGMIDEEGLHFTEQQGSAFESFQDIFSKVRGGKK